MEPESRQKNIPGSFQRNIFFTQMKVHLNFAVTARDSLNDASGVLTSRVRVPSS